MAMRVLFQNIKELVQVRESASGFIAGADMKCLPTLKNAYLITQDDIIQNFGLMSDLSEQSYDTVIDATGRTIIPSWCDSHTHLVFADSREGEFVDRINGLSYEEIAIKGGGILNSALKLQSKSEDELYEQSKERLDKLILQGTGAIEIKSGYGLTLESEMKMLKVINRLKKNSGIPIKSTFLGAHALPNSYADNKSGYIDHVIHDMMPQIEKESLADFVDIFCENGYFSTGDMEKVIVAGKKYHWEAKVHVNQFNAIGGVKVAVDNGARSVDHLEQFTDEDLSVLKGGHTMPTSLPGCSFFLNIPYTPARRIIDSGLPLAVASDFNPGSCPSGNMNFVVALACTQLKLTPAEAINAATINGAFAMDVLDRMGSITKGKLANFIMTKPIKSYHMIPYSFGESLIDKVFVRGKEFVKS